MDAILKVILDFCGEFSFSLYDTGFGDVMADFMQERTGSDIKDPVMRMACAMHFLDGYAQACKHANACHSARWQIAIHISGFAAQIANSLHAYNDNLESYEAIISVTRKLLQKDIERLKTGL